MGDPEIIYIERNQENDEHEDIDELKMLDGVPTTDDDTNLVPMLK